MLTGVGIALAARMLLWNIGGDGQIYMGAIAASGVALFIPRLPAIVMIPTMMAAGFAGGALWMAVPALLRAFMGVNEIITTLMLNYIAISWNDYLVFGPWKDPRGFNEPTSAQFPSTAMLSTLWGSRVHIGIFFGLAAAVILYLVLKRTRWGYEVRVTGESQKAARYAGMNIKRNILLVMLISGGLAGLAGMAEVAGVLGRLQQGISPGYGYTAILVAVMAKLDPLAIVVVSLLFGGLLVGGYAVQTIGVPNAIVSTLQGAIIFFVLAGEFLARYRLNYERRDG
jgi:simple sugar transport system permease protein